MQVLVISGGIHLVALLIFGGITVVKFIIPDEAQFEEPPAFAEVEPPKEVKVEIKPPAAPQQSATRMLKMRQVGNIAVSAVDVTLPSMNQAFTVSGGLGGFGGGSLLGGTRGSIGIGMSEISVFGLKSRAERVLFVIDASKTMLTDEKGGLNSYRVIKNEIADMVANLSTGTLFNVVFYDDGKLLFFRPRPVPAGSTISTQLSEWIAPINANASSLGLKGADRVPLTAMTGNPVQDEIPKYQWSSGNENALLSQVFLEQSVDAIFIVTGRHRGFEKVRRSATDREESDWKRVTSSSSYQEKLLIYKNERNEAEAKARAELARINAERKKKGQPPKIIDGGGLVGKMGIEMQAEHPGYEPSYTIDESKVRQYFKDLVQKLYQDKGGIAPSIHIVLFLAGDEKFSEEQEDALQDYVRFFDGRYRIIRGLNEIEGARSSSTTKN